MKKRLLLPLGGAITAGCLAAAVATPVQAAPKVFTTATLTPAAAAADVLGFWADDDGAHLKAADPYGLDHKSVPALVSTGARAADGEPGLVPATGGAKKADGKSKNVNLPKTAGRVFFTVGDEPFSCSGSAVRSRYGNLVATAGHCVYDVESDAPVKRWVFIPGYYDGKAPWGLYVGKQSFTHHDFDAYKDIDRDYAFVTVYNGIARGKDRWADVGSLSKKVGGQGLAYNQKIGAPVFVFGYPAAPHEDGDQAWSGEKLKWCYGKPFFPVSEPSVKVQEQVGLRCAMTGGSSGGPWIVKYDSAHRVGYVNGVTSLGGDVDGNGRSDIITSPYFDGETYGVFKAAYPRWSGSIVRKDGTLGVTETR